MKEKLNKRKKRCIFCFLIAIFSCLLGEEIIAATIEEVKVNVPSAIVIDQATGRVLFEQNAYEKRAMASLTKMMTSIMLVENCKLDELIAVPDSATYIGGSELGLKKGDEIRARDLLVGMLLPSGNDCAYTVAIHIGGTIENFANMMTQRARSLGAKNSTFKNPHGLDVEGHESTAYDMALITSYAIKNSVISDIINMKSASVTVKGRSISVKNTNRLLSTYEPVNGGKTGYTGKAERCLITTATKGKLNVISVVLGAVNTDLRFDSSEYILEQVFNNYHYEDISSVMHFYTKIPIIKGKEAYYESRIDKGEFLYPLKENEIEQIVVKQEYPTFLQAGAKKGDYIGDVEVSLGNENIYSDKVYLDYDIEKKRFWDYIGDIFTSFVKQIQQVDLIFWK